MTLETIARKHGLPVPSEESEQRTVARYLDLLKLRWMHVPNGGMRNKAEGGKLKAQGVKRGVPDIWIFDPPPKFPNSPGVVIELKRRKGGSVSPEQKEWLGYLNQRGWIAKVCNGAGEAMDLLAMLGYGGSSSYQIQERER